MRKGSGLDGHGQEHAEQRREPAANASGVARDLESRMVARAHGESAANDASPSGTLQEHTAIIWRLLRAMEVSCDDTPPCCVSAFEEAFARLSSNRASNGEAYPDAAPNAPEAVGGIPIEHVVDPLLAAAFRAARVHWQAVLQSPGSDRGSSSVRRQGELLVLGLLGSLDESKRVILLLADMEQLSSPEIAALMGLPLDIAYDELRKARRAFVRARKRLEHIGATGDAETEARELLALARTRFSPDPAALSRVSQQLQGRG